MGNGFEALKPLAMDLKAKYRGRVEEEKKKERVQTRIARETLEFLETMKKDGVKSHPDVRLKANTEDRDIDFLSAMREAGVTSLKDARSVVRKKPVRVISKQTIEQSPKPAREAMSDDADSLIEFLESDDGLSFRRPEVGPDVARDLRRGRWVVMAQLDLHGMFVEEAREAVAKFIVTAQANGRYCVRIVHGKGNGSPGGQSILREKVRRWLKQRDEVIAFAEPHERDGGAGATIVRLKALPRN